MRFRLLFVLFNAMIAGLFAMVFSMPVIVLGWDHARLFWTANWPVAIVFIVVVAGLNGYFVTNRGFLTLLEKEDWKGLAGWLERRVVKGTFVTRQHVEMLVNACLVTGALDRLRAVEHAVTSRRPRLLKRFAAEFGVRYLVSADPAESESYFGRMVSDPGVGSPLWVRFFHGVTLRLSGRADEARGQLVAVLAEARDPVLRLLCAYLLDRSADNPDDVRAMVANTRSGLSTRYDDSAWAAVRERRRGDLRLVAMGSLLDAASAWLWTNGGS